MEHRTYKTIYKYVIIFLSLVSCFMFNVSYSFAQQVSLSLSPPHLETVIKPGKTILIAYTLQNYGDPTVITARVLPFVPQDNNGDVSIKDSFEGPIRFSLENADIQLDKPFFLRPQQSQQLLLRIRVPEGAPEQDYYYTLIAETGEPPSTDGATSSRATAAIGSHILITTTQSGFSEVKAKVSIFDIIKKYTLPIFGKVNIFDSNDPIPLVMIISNNGKNLVKPEGEIVLRGNFGEKATYTIVPRNILAESQRIVSATPSAELDCEANKGQLCNTPISLLLKGFFIGKYRISTQLDFGDNTPVLSAATSFIALPFKFLFAILVAITIGVFVIMRLKNKEE